MSTALHRMASRPTPPWLLAGLALLALGVPIPSPALAHTQLQPALFALSQDSFPPGSQVVRAGVEGNRSLLLDDQLHFGLPAASLGRLSGYYMDAVEGPPNAQPRVYTSYLVSIFRTVHEAEVAFQLRYDNWFDVDYFTSPSPAPVVVGDNGEEALFQSLDVSRPHVSELFFVRGTLLVEVFQGIGYRESTAGELQSFYGIATRLDTLARKHPLGA